MGAFYNQHEIAFRAVRILNQGFYGLVLVAVVTFPIVYLASKRRSGSEWIWLGVLLALYVTAISIVFSGQSRYHFPIMPFLIVNSAYVLSKLVTSQQQDNVDHAEF